MVLTFFGEPCQQNTIRLQAHPYFDYFAHQRLWLPGSCFVGYLLMVDVTHCSFDYGVDL